MEYISKQIEKICKDCGKPFIGDPRKRYCFDCLHKRDVERRKAWSEKKRECREIRKQYKEEQKPKGLTLSDVAKLANAAGMSYGEYVARCMT